MLRTVLLISLFIATASASATEPKPKYGPAATPMRYSEEYFRKNPAPDFWALIPYYTLQQTGSSCSLASVTTVVNGARDPRKLTTDDELATQNGILERVKIDAWQKAVAQGGHGVALDELPKYVEAALKAYGVNAKAEAVHVGDTTGATLEQVRKDLIANEKSANNFIIANFIQGVYTGDADVGHISPVGAYDAENHRVLILDVDRTWYEPYWVSDETFINGMSTRDATTRHTRGYVKVTISR